MDDYKPCPFCGGFAVGFVDEDYTDIVNGKPVWQMRFCVSCVKCMSRTGYYSDPEKSREAWNKRTNEQEK
jgi:hypothetical protein